MGLVKKADDEDKAADAPEDPPVVKQLKEIDDRYLAVEQEYNREVHKLMLKFEEQQQPLLEERKQVLLAKDGDAAPETGTPGLSGFWLTAMQNHPALEDLIQEWDEPVLEFLQDIEKGHLDKEDGEKGFTLTFRFAPNPYFNNTELTKEYHTEVKNPYAGEVEMKEIKCSTVDWQAGKDVTVEKVAKKVKGGGAKKAKQKKEKEEPRPSFFRDMFRNLKAGMTLPEDARMQAQSMMDAEEDEEDEENDVALISILMENDNEVGMAIRDNIIPFAVRWYTGEAAPEQDEDDEDDEDDDEDDEDDDDEDDSEDDLPPKGRGRGAPKRKAKATPKTSPELKAGEAPKEECKQQ